MNILVIGNGFDIALGLKTYYKDYLNYVNTFWYLHNEIKEKHNSSPDINSIVDSVFIKPILELLNNSSKEENKKFIEDQIKLLNDNTWISHFNNAKIKDDWVDFEKEISRLVQQADCIRRDIISDKSTINEFLKTTPISLECEVYKFLRDKDKTRIGIKEVSEIKEKMLYDLKRLIHSFELYLVNFVEKQTITKKLAFLNDIKIDRIISFNYTDTFERKYGNGKSKDKYHYIHGKAETGKDVENSSLVLGIDEYLIGEEKNESNEFIEFKKFFQRIYKKTGNDYREWLGVLDEVYNKTPKLGRSELNIYFYGHSLDVTDKDVISELIRQKKAKTTIYYHNQDALKRQISNLVKVLGEDDLICRTSGYKPSIIFVPCP